jgi:hypothetical protein
MTGRTGIDAALVTTAKLCSDNLTWLLTKLYIAVWRLDGRACWAKWRVSRVDLGAG